MIVTCGGITMPQQPSGVLVPPSGFSPPASTVFWLDPAAAFVTKDGLDNVSGIVDRNGSARTLQQPTAIDQPLWEAAGLNGRPSIRCDVANTEYLFSSSAGLADLASGTDTPWTVVMAVQQVTISGTVAAKVLFSWGNSTNGNPIIYLAESVVTLNKFTSRKSDDLNVTANVTSTQSADTGRHVISVVQAGTDVSVYIDGVATSINAAAQNVGATTTDRFALGALLRSVATNHSDTRFGEVFVLSGANSADRIACEDYLIPRYV